MNLEKLEQTKKTEKLKSIVVELSRNECHIIVNLVTFSRLEKGRYYINVTYESILEFQ